MGRFRGGSFCIGIIRIVLCIRTHNVRHFYYGGKDTIMSILLAVGGGALWCGTVYFILKFLGFCARKDKEVENYEERKTE